MSALSFCRFVSREKLFFKHTAASLFFIIINLAEVYINLGVVYINLAEI